MLRVLGTERELARALCEREGFEACCPRELTVWMTDWASGPSYGRIVTGEPEVPRMGGGNATVCRYARLAIKKKWGSLGLLQIAIGF